MYLRDSLALVMCVALVSCGGGGGSAGSGLPQTPAAAPVSAGTASAVITIAIPAAPSGGSALRRSPLYVSAGTQSAAIAVNGGTPVVVSLAAGSPNCTAVAGGGRTCSVTISAPVGADTFAETLYASTNGTGAALSQNSTTATITAGKANAVNLVLDGVVAAIVLSLSNPAPPVGTAATISLQVNVNDASGAAIIGSDPFANPITLKDSDTSGDTTLSKTTLGSPADAANVTIAYNGGSLSSAAFTASAAGVTPAVATLTPKAAGAVVFNDYSTYDYDNGRDSFNPNTTAITPASVPKIHLAWQSALGGGDFNTQTQPVLATGIPGHAGVLFVGGGSGNVYAYDALNGSKLWTTNTGQEQYNCGTNGPYYFGVGGTVAYDPSSKSLYAVGSSNASPNAYAANWLYHLDGATGAVINKVNFAPAAAGSPSELNFAHTSVTLNNGIAYVGTGSTCDISSWRGSVVAISVPSMSVLSTFFPLWDPQNTRGFGAGLGGGGIWGWGGVSIDPSGNVLTGVGNADNGVSNGVVKPPFVAAPQENTGYAETLLALTSDVKTVVASNHPIPAGTFSNTANDLDVQGTPLVFSPTGCGTMVALQGKSGELNVYNESSLSNGPVAQYQLSPTDSDDAYLGDPAYSSATGLVYAPVAHSTSPTLIPPGLIAINPGCGNPSVTWKAAFGVDSSGSATPRAAPAVSAGGVVFAGTVDPNVTGGDVYAIDASTGTVLNGGSPILVTNGNLRTPPTIDGNWIFVLDNNSNMYGLTIDPSYAAIKAVHRGPDARQRKSLSAKRVGS